jgi:hypothetical protein
MTNWAPIREALYERAGGRCEISGRPLGDSWAAHHRRKRGSGGTRKPDVHTLPNLLALCHEAHNLGRPSAHLDPAWAAERGFMIPEWEVPRLTPVKILCRKWVLLTSAGGYLDIPQDMMRPPAGIDRGPRTGDQ